MTSSLGASAVADKTFNFGYLATESPGDLPELPDWRSRTVGNLTVHLHPNSRFAQAQAGAESASVTLIGDPVDLGAATTDTEAIAATAASILATGGLDQALRFVAYLGGRWTALLDDGTETVVVPDFSASQSVYWHHDHRGTAFSNFAHLLAEARQTPVNEPYRKLMQDARELGATGTVYWPGVETPFEDVLPVLPNHALHLAPGRTPAHRRFYPFPETQAPRDPDLAYEHFRDRFFRHVELLCRLGENVGISLTAGADSRTTLAAAAPHLDRQRTLAWTYLDTGTPHAGMQADAEAAVDLAGRYGLRHQVIDLNPAGLRGLAQPATEFRRAYTRSMKYTPQFRRLALAYDEQLPPGTMELQSTVAETGTGFYKRRSGRPDVERLSRLYSAAPFNEHPLVRSAFERYIGYADLSGTQDGPLDWHDLFYQESRLARWAALRVQEGDLSHRVLLPFNARGVIEALAGPDLEQRVQKQALFRVLAEHEPTA
jgi:hypothetical protein